jgi:hypothetical protein
VEASSRTAQQYIQAKNVLSMHMIEEENKTRKIASMSTTILEKKIANF